MATKILGYLLPQRGDLTEDKEKRLAYLNWFAVNIPETEFNGVDRILYHFMLDMVRVNSLLKRNQFENIMTRMLLPYLLKEKVKIDEVKEYSFESPSSIDTIVNITKDIVLQVYDTIVDVEDLGVEDFSAEAKLFFEDQKKTRMIDILSTGYSLLTNMQNGMVGTDDAVSTVSDRLEELEELYGTDKLEELTAGDSSEELTFDFVSDYGIPELDNDTLGIWTRQLLGVDGAPGVGKTKFAVGPIAYRAFVNHKKDVIYYALEQSGAEIKAMLIAIHIFNLYGEVISDSLILKRKLKDERLQRMVDTARADLFDSGLYGKFVVIEGDLYVNHLYSKLKVMDKLKGPFDMVIIDYMFLIAHKSEKYVKNMDFAEVIKRAYRLFKRYCLREKKAGVALNQLNDKGIEAGEKDQQINQRMSAGGIEVYRNTDYHVVITMTPEMEVQSKRRLSTPKKRSSVGAGRFMVNTNLAVCSFSSMGGSL